MIASLFSAQEEMIERIIRELTGIFGSTDRVSPSLTFDRTRYYAREMGWPLYRRFLSFERTVRPEHIVDIKLETNAVERRYLHGENRTVNIDPGYIALERLVLATGKNYTHRIYLSKGIYADLTLIFHRGSFRPLPWTYRDYAEPETIAFFNQIRQTYKERLRENATRGLGEADGRKEG